MTLVADPTTLQSYLGVANIDAARAAIILEMATDLCTSIVDPLPDEAAVVVLAVASRAFSNPEGVTAETVGPYTVQRGAAGLYLTKGDKAALRRFAGGTGAFSIDTMPTGVNAVQLVIVTATGGTFKLALSGQSTVPIAYNALASDVATALGNLSLIGAGNVSVSGNGPYTVTFVNDLATTPIPTLTADGSLLTGTVPLVTVTTTTAGVYAPGQNLAPWDKDYFQSTGGVVGPSAF